MSLRIDPDADQPARNAFSVPDLGAGCVPYAVGFLFSTDGRVALVRKARPVWQAGRFNGVGGKVEPGETPAAAMRREFWEEAGVDHAHWDHYASVTFPAGVLWVFRATVADEVLDQVRTCTDEPIEVVAVSDLLAGRFPVIPNLHWLVPLGLYTHDHYVPLVAHEVPVSQ